MILQVHDELNFSALPEKKKQVKRIAMEEIQDAYPPRIPLIADDGWGKNWLGAH